MLLHVKSALSRLQSQLLPPSAYSVLLHRAACEQVKEKILADSRTVIGQESATSVTSSVLYRQRKRHDRVSSS